MAVASACLVFAIDPASDPLAAPKPLTSQERAEVRALLVEFRKASEPSERSRCVNKIRSYGTEATERLLAELQSHVRELLGKYKAEISKSAYGSATKRLSKKEQEEVAHLRKTVRDLSARDDLSEGLIRSAADPAVARLRELLQPISVDAVKESARAAALKKLLKEINGYHGQCARSLKKETIDVNAQIESFKLSIAAKPVFTREGKTSVRSANERAASRLDRREADCILDLNVLRLLLGIPPVRTDVKLCEAARDHSMDMKTLNFFAHVSPIKGKETHVERAKNFRTTAVSENIFKGSDSARVANEGWFHSPGHHKNMLDPNHKFVGIGYYDKHWTAMFR